MLLRSCSSVMAMTDLAVGIDIGTTYTKAVARTEDGSVVAVSRMRSPHSVTRRPTTLIEAAEWWACLKDVLRTLLTAYAPRPRVASICVSAIAPTLTVFDASEEDKAYSILYSSLGEVEDRALISQSDPQLTERRLALLRRAAREEH